jgi:hypothetical protein
MRQGKRLPLFADGQIFGGRFGHPLFQMDVTVFLMIVDAQSLLAIEKLAFAAFSRSFQYFCHVYSFRGIFRIGLWLYGPFRTVETGSSSAQYSTNSPKGFIYSVQRP